MRFVARFNPAHGTPEIFRGVSDDDVLAIKRRLDAETAAHVARRDNADFFRRQFEYVDEREAVDMRPLRRDVGREAVGIVPFAQHAARFHRRDPGAVHLEALADDDVR